MTVKRIVASLCSNTFQRFHSARNNGLYPHDMHYYPHNLHLNQSDSHLYQHLSPASKFIARQYQYCLHGKT